jgi:hypothetical protein
MPSLRSTIIGGRGSLVGYSRYTKINQRNDQCLENYHNDRDERHRLQQLKFNGEQLDKFKALEEARILCSKCGRERRHKDDGWRWTCEVCNTCSFETAEVQRFMKNCVLPRRAWSQNGRVMYANPVHLKRLSNTAPQAPMVVSFI